MNTGCRIIDFELFNATILIPVVDLVVRKYGTNMTGINSTLTVMRSSVNLARVRN